MRTMRPRYRPDPLERIAARLLELHLPSTAWAKHIDALRASRAQRELKRPCKSLLARKMHRLGRISCKVLIFRGIKFVT